MSQRGPNQPWEHGELGPGVLVTPTIRLERQLGSGGMGSVWLAEHLTLRAQVVVKFMAREFASNPEARLRFEREASLAAQAKSPHVVQIFDHGTALFGLPYIAMELLEGEDLAKRIEREGRIEPHLFSDLLSQACRGLARAHAKGITHRDIKPENIFLCEDDGRLLVKLLDFGIAKVEAGGANFSATQTGMLLGTAYYMSPEQTLGQRDVDQRADLWALGVVSYFALTGRRPFGGNTLGALAIEVTSAAIVPPSAHDPRLGPGVDGWMAKALARPREQRFQSAKAMAEAFEQALAQLSLHATVYDRASSGPLASPTLASNAPPPLRVASTMSPSIRNASDSARAATSPSQKRRSPLGWLVAGLALLGAVAFSVVWRLSSRPSAPGSSPLPSVVAAATQAPSEAPIAQSVPSVPLTPPSALPAPPMSASAAVAPASAVRTPSSLRPALAKTAAPSTVTAHSDAPPPAATASASKPAPTKSPLQMEIK